MPTLDRDGFRRVINQTKRGENSPRNRVERATSPRILQVCKVGITTSAITARAGKLPGSGTVQPYTLNDPGDELIATGDEAPLRNWTGSAVASGIWVKFVTLDGRLFLDGTDCSGVAP